MQAISYSGLPFTDDFTKIRFYGEVRSSGKQEGSQVSNPLPDGALQLALLVEMPACGGDVISI
jgi:hypothetical protein